MTEWTWWVALGMGIVVSMFLARTRNDKKDEDLHRAKTDDHESRLVKLESTNMTERDVRAVLKDFFLPFMTGIQQVSRDVQDLKVQVAKLNDRKDKE